MTAPISYKRCPRCGHLARTDRMIKGYGSSCAEMLGLTGAAVDVGQDGPDLFDAHLAEDECDGWDRPADRP